MDEQEKRAADEKVAAEVQMEIRQAGKVGSEGSDIDDSNEQSGGSISDEPASAEACEDGDSIPTTARTAEGNELTSSSAALQGGSSCHASNDASADSEQGEGSAENPSDTRRRSLNRRFIAIVAAVALGVVAVAAIAFNVLVIGMPDIRGMAPNEAYEELLDASESWAVEFVIDEGESVAVESLKDYGGYEVKETEPSAGTFLGRNDESVRIQVTIGKTEETLKQERQAIIDAEIADSLANGFEREEYEDGGTYVLFRAYDSESAIGGDRYFYISSEEDDPDIELYREMAGRLRSSVIAACYTEDGYLVQLYYAPYSEASEEELAQDSEVLGRVVQEAQTFNRQNAETFLSQWCSATQEYERQMDRPLTCEYTLESDSASIYFMYDWANIIYTGNAREINESRARRQAQTDWLAWCLGRDTSVLTYNSENELFDSSEASADAYNPLTVIDSVPEGGE